MDNQRSKCQVCLPVETSANVYHAQRNGFTETNIESLATPIAISSIVYSPGSGVLIQDVAMCIIEQLLTEVSIHLYSTIVI